MPARLISPNGKRKVLAPVRPNAGLQARYRSRLDAAIEEMHQSVTYWLKARYRANPPAMAQALAMDRTPAEELSDVMADLTQRWMRKFDKLARDLGAYFATEAAARSDASLAAALRKGGMTVRFRMTPEASDVVRASVEENVLLIKSIGEQHLSEVAQLAQRSVATGRDLEVLAKGLERRLSVTKRRAAFIARDQNEKATAAIVRTRQQELGITTAIWLHSGAGKHPRPEHLAASGKTYDVSKGMFLEGKWTWPGVEINCRCVSRAVVAGFD